MEMKVQKGALSCTTTPHSPGQKPQEGAYTLLPSVGAGGKLFCTCKGPANEKPLHLASSLLLFCLQQPLPAPSLQPSSIKECSSPLFSGLAYGFPVACIAQIAVLHYSLINPFCWYNNWQFY